MIMTISQGGKRFDIEQSAGRRRSTDSFADNEGVLSGGSPRNPIEPRGIASGPEFLQTGLPHRVLTRVRGVVLNRNGRRVDTATGRAISGTGGGFLSNEIFYRTRLLQTNTSGAPPIPLGHLHVPFNQTRQQIISKVREILQAALPSI